MPKVHSITFYCPSVLSKHLRHKLVILKVHALIAIQSLLYIYIYQPVVTSMVCLLLHLFADSTTENSQSAITGEHNTIFKHTVTPAPSNKLNTDAIIAGTSGIIVLLLLLVSVTVVVLMVYGVQKRKKWTQESDDPAGIRYAI